VGEWQAGINLEAANQAVGYLAVGSGCSLFELLEVLVLQRDICVGARQFVTPLSWRPRHA